MKVLVIGGGGREHALCWKLKQSPLLTQLFCSPGNAGIAQIAECLQGEPVEIAQRIGADLVVIGPDDFLAAGLVDQLEAVGIPAFGPTQEAAQLESSKIFCKELMRKYAIPSGDFHAFENGESARKYLQDAPDKPMVVKADGLALGKGVVLANNRAEAMEAVDVVINAARGQQQVLIEEFLSGPEVSLLALTDGENVLPLVPAQDHKRIGEGDTGPNTGGMGCYSPVPIFDSNAVNHALETILLPTVRALKSEGIIYRGVLYAGLMLTEDGPKVLEYNCRFGDPETQVVLPRMESDLLPLLLSCVGNGALLNSHHVQWSLQAAMTVVMASKGYPASSHKGDVISGLDDAQKNALIFHAGTKTENGEIVTNGGRVLAATGLGDDLSSARTAAYRGIEEIEFAGAQYRRDIGWRAL